MEIKTQPCEEDAENWHGVPTKGEMFLYQLNGSSTIRIRRKPGDDSNEENSETPEIAEHELGEGHVLLVPGNDAFEMQYDWGKDGLCLVVTNSVLVSKT